MSQTLHMFFAGTRDGVAIEIAAGDAPADVAARAKTRLTESGWCGQVVLLGIPSPWCLAAAVSTAGLPKNDRKAMLYRFEELIPLPAEDVIADFVQHGDTALGVCGRTEQLLPLVDALEAASVPVQSITPTALLAARGPSDQGATVLLIEEQDHVNVIGLEAGRPVSWSLVPSVNALLHQQIAAMRFDVAPKITPTSLDPTTATKAATAALEGERAWIELRRDALAPRDRLRTHRKPLNAALAAAAALLIAIAGALFVSAQRYAHEQADDQRELASAFEKAFPGWPVPGNVRAVIQSEQRKLDGKASGALPAEFTESALRTMHRVLDKLPADLCYKFERMIFSDTAFELQGRLRSYEDADKLAAVARAAGLDVVPPQTRREADGSWSFTLRAERTSKSPPLPPALAHQD